MDNVVVRSQIPLYESTDDSLGTSDHLSCFAVLPQGAGWVLSTGNVAEDKDGYRKGNRGWREQRSLAGQELK